jgi:hypothetical protein
MVIKGDSMTIEELTEWFKWYRQYKNGYHMSKWDWGQFTHLNHKVMELSHEIHNKNMLDK